MALDIQEISLNENDKPKQRLLFIKDVEAIIGKDRLTLRRWRLKGIFPKPFKLHDMVLVWHASTIEEWLNNIN